MLRNAIAKGFTLVELMVVVAIIGVLSSIAIPEMMRLTLRSKQAERLHVMVTIKKAVENLYLQTGDLPNDPATGHPYPAIVGPWTPALPPTQQRRMPVWNQDDWNKVMTSSAVMTNSAGAPEIMGALFYSYSLTVTRGTAGTPTQFVLWAAGDLDGDGDVSYRQLTYQRDAGGIFRLLDGAGLQYPIDWFDGGIDDGRF